MYVCIYAGIHYDRIDRSPLLFSDFLTSAYGRFTRTVPPSFIYKLEITFSASSFTSLSLFHVLL